jgi:hypothetical protein
VESNKVGESEFETSLLSKISNITVFGKAHIYNKSGCKYFMCQLVGKAGDLRKPVKAYSNYVDEINFIKKYVKIEKEELDTNKGGTVPALENSSYSNYPKPKKETLNNSLLNHEQERLDKNRKGSISEAKYENKDLILEKSNLIMDRKKDL